MSQQHRLGTPAPGPDEQLGRLVPRRCVSITRRPHDHSSCAGAATAATVTAATAAAAGAGAAATTATTASNAERACQRDRRRGCRGHGRRAWQRSARPLDMSREPEAMRLREPQPAALSGSNHPETTVAEKQAQVKEGLIRQSKEGARPLAWQSMTPRG